MDNLKKCIQDSLKGYMENYDLELNPLLITATFLHPSYKKFDFGDDQEKKNIIN